MNLLEPYHQTYTYDTGNNGTVENKNPKNNQKTPYL